MVSPAGVAPRSAGGVEADPGQAVDGDGANGGINVDVDEALRGGYGSREPAEAAQLFEIATVIVMID